MQALTLEQLEAQTVMELPDRNTLRWSLVYVKTGNINVLSFNDVNVCLNTQAALLALGFQIIKGCHQSN
jgi:hypothetical protein